MTTRRRTISCAKENGGNTVGIDPHKKTLSACIIDERGGVLDVAHFKVSGDGHRALETWARRHGPVATWGIEGASSLGRHTSIFLIERGHDVRDVCPNRTNQRGRGRHQGKTDRLDAERIARETQSSPATPVAFKRAGGDSGPDETAELLALWHNTRRSLTKVRVQLLSEVETLLLALPEEIRDELPDTKGIRPRLAALAARDRTARWNAPTDSACVFSTITPSSSLTW